MRARPRRGPRRPARARRSLEVDEEEVVAEAGAPRPRLDPGEVHAAAGELAQHVDQPARRLVAAAPEDDRRLRRPRPVSPTSSAGASQTKRVSLSGWSSTFVGHDVAVVQLGGQARAERDAAVARSGTRCSTASAVERRAHVLRVAAAARAGSERTGRWPAGARPRARRSTATARSRAITQWWIGCTTSAWMRTPLGLDGERVERDRDAALERVLDRDDRALDRALLHGHHRVVDRGIRDRLDAGRRRRAQRLVAVRPRGTEVARPRMQASRGASAGQPRPRPPAAPPARARTPELPSLHAASRRGAPGRGGGSTRSRRPYWRSSSSATVLDCWPDSSFMAS